MAKTRDGKPLQDASRCRPGKLGVLALANELDAFAARALLIEAADRAIDVQYYICDRSASARRPPWWSRSSSCATRLLAMI